MKGTMQKISGPEASRRKQHAKGDSLVFVRGQDGAILIGIILVMTMVAGIGSFVVKMNTDATQSELGANKSNKAYYLAESGLRYALPRIETAIKAGNNPVTTLSYSNTSYTLTNTDSFILTLTGADPTYSLVAKGSINSDGASVAAARTINYTITVPPGYDGDPIPFVDPTVDPNHHRSRSHSDHHGRNRGAIDSNNWDTEGRVRVQSHHSGAPSTTVQLNSHYNEHGHGHENRGGVASTMVSLDWTNDNSTLPEFDVIWEGKDSLLSYEVQTKVKIGGGSDSDHSDNRHDMVTGIAFRLNDQQNSSSVVDDSFYGLSYLYNASDDSHLPTFSPAQTFDTDCVYLILWKQVSGTKTVLAKKKLSTSDGVVISHTESHGHVSYTTYQLKDWSTLVVNVKESYRKDANGNYVDYNNNVVTAANRVRENRIYAYFTDTSDYAANTVNWTYTPFTQVSGWTLATGVTSCSSEGESSCILDHSLTSANFDDIDPNEIGLHAFGDDDVELGDFAVRIDQDLLVTQN